MWWEGFAWLGLTVLSYIWEAAAPMWLILLAERGNGTEMILLFLFLFLFSLDRDVM
jgi:hypothetical protein